MTNPMTNPAGATAPTQPADTSGFFVNTGTHSGWFTTPTGDVYDIRKLEPREVTDPRNGEVTTLWGGYATARDRELAAKDAMLQAEFKKTGARPAELFAPEARDIPLYITLRHRPGKGYTDIGSFWNAKGRYTIFARDLEANVVSASVATCCPGNLQPTWKPNAPPRPIWQRPLLPVQSNRMAPVRATVPPSVPAKVAMPCRVPMPEVHR